MSGRGRFRPNRLVGCLIPLMGTVAFLGGCGTKTGPQALDEEFKRNPQFKQVTTAKFSGRVTVDGQPPAEGIRVCVILQDPKKFEDPNVLSAPKLFAICDINGNFVFHTYTKDDGVTAGKYVVVFAGLNVPKLPGMHRAFGITLGGPDALHNLYNDPAKNSKDDKFVLDLQPPGKTDYDFDLTVAGKEPEKPAPLAWTKVVTR